MNRIIRTGIIQQHNTGDIADNRRRSLEIYKNFRTNGK